MPICKKKPITSPLRSTYYWLTRRLAVCLSLHLPYSLNQFFYILVDNYCDDFFARLGADVGIGTYDIHIKHCFDCRFEFFTRILKQCGSSIFYHLDSTWILGQVFFRYTQETFESYQDQILKDDGPDFLWTSTHLFNFKLTDRFAQFRFDLSFCH